MWKELFDTNTLKKGKQIQDDCITFLKIDNTELYAQVQGTLLYDVRIDSHLNMSCSCPQFVSMGVNCKHLACVLLKNDKNGNNGISRLEFDYSNPKFVDNLNVDDRLNANTDKAINEVKTEYGAIDNIAQIIPSVVEKYWCYGFNKEKPHEVSIFSPNKYYWRNSTGVLFHRAPLDIDVPSNQSSQPEAFFYCLLKQIFSDAIHRDKVQAIEMDIYIPSINIAIEYDGSYYHKDKLEQDLQKNKQLNKLGIYVVRIRDRKCPPLTDKNNAIIRCEYERDNSTIQEILSAIYKRIKKYDN